MDALREENQRLRSEMKMLQEAVEKRERTESPLRLQMEIERELEEIGQSVSLIPDQRKLDLERQVNVFKRSLAKITQSRACTPSFKLPYRQSIQCSSKRSFDMSPGERKLLNEIQRLDRENSELKRRLGKRKVKVKKKENTCKRCSQLLILGFSTKYCYIHGKRSS